MEKNDLISRAAARDVINTWGRQKSEKIRMGLLHRDLDAIPTVDAIPVEWLRDKMQKPQMTDGNPFGFVLAEWLEEQGARGT